MKFFLIIILLNIAFINIGCTQPISRNLYIESRDDDLCIFTNNKNTFLGKDSSFIVFIGELEDSQPYKVIYSKDYSNIKFPTRVEECLTIPTKNLELNKIYEVNLESNKNFSQRFCLTMNKKKRKLHLIDTHKSCEM